MGVGLGTRVRARCHGRSFRCPVLWACEIFISLVSFGFKAGAYGLASGRGGARCFPGAALSGIKGQPYFLLTCLLSLSLVMRTQKETQCIT